MQSFFHGQEKSGGIYRITNGVNGRVYLGSTKGFSDRKRKHNSALLRGGHHNHELQRDFCLYGEGVFTFEVVKVILDEPLRVQTEIEMILEILGGGCYNVSAYGKMTLSHSQATKDKIRNALKGRTPSLEAREKNRQAQLGKRHSPETREKISQRAKDQIRLPKSQETIEKLRAISTGRKHTPETKARMSKARKGRVLSEDHRKRISLGQVGRVQSPETRAKISAANRRRYSNPK